MTTSRIYRHYWPRVLAALRDDDTSRALRLARRLVWLRGDDPNAWEVLGKTEMQVNGRPKAEEVLREGIARTNGELLRYRLGELMLHRPVRDSEAEAIFRQLVEERPSWPYGYLGLCDVAMLRRDLEAAREYALSALERRDSDAARWTDFEVGRRLLEIPGEWDHGVSLLERFVHDNPDEVSPHQYLAAVYAHTDPERSAEHLETARRLYGPRHEAVDERAKEIRDWLDQWGSRDLQAT